LIGSLAAALVALICCSLLLSLASAAPAIKTDGKNKLVDSEKPPIRTKRAEEVITFGNVQNEPRIKKLDQSDHHDVIKRVDDIINEVTDESPGEEKPMLSTEDEMYGEEEIKENKSGGDTAERKENNTEGGAGSEDELF